MRQCLAACVIAAATRVTISSEASAWACRAGSPTGSWGVGWHNYSLAYAKRRALLECAARMPSAYTLFMTRCPVSRPAAHRIKSTAMLNARWRGRQDRGNPPHFYTSESYRRVEVRE
jgi:hypothetical protein